MPIDLIRVPQLNANDDSAELVKWVCSDRAYVEAGDVLAVVETSKTTFDVEAPVSGYCAHLVGVGSRLAVDAVFAVMLEDVHQDPQEILARAGPVVAPSSERMWTKKAEITARKLGIDIVALAHKLGRSLTDADVVASASTSVGSSADLSDLADDRYPFQRRERVLLIGGGGGGGGITLDAIFRTTHQRAVGILDNNPELWGKTMFGVPILGANAMVKELWDQKFFDAAIIVVTAQIDQRKGLFENLVALKIPTTNVIDPSVEIRANVQMGTGNLIMANGFIAACVAVGDNNFMASHVCIEHHSVVGNHCTFGPRTTTSGAVVVGNEVKFGMGVLVEPYLRIGSGSLIPSGCVLTQSVPSNSVVKMQSIQTIKSRASSDANQQ